MILRLKVMLGQICFQIKMNLNLDLVQNKQLIDNHESENFSYSKIENA